MKTELKLHIEKILKKKTNTKKQFSWQSVSGGSINEAYKVLNTEAKFFVKVNTISIFKNGFKEEVEGLNFLNENKTLTPNVIAYGIKNKFAYLILEWIETGNKTDTFWNNFAQQLALLHQQKSDKFGLKTDNFMGELSQKNSYSNSFSHFFIENRLKPQVKMAYNNQLLSKTHLQHFENLYAKLDAIFPTEKPTAVHGDLWSGNFIANTKQKAVLIDPAVYYGHREIDLAMTKLFGGFSTVFYNTYNEIYPLENGFENRYEVYNLYPLLIHLNLFGKSYLHSIKSIISQF